MSQNHLHHLGVKIPKRLKKEMEELINQGYYLNESDLVRDSIRKLLDSVDTHEKRLAK